MSKYDKLKELRKTRANKVHFCDNCSKIIKQNTFYYKESLSGKFLQNLHSKKYCSECYDKFGLKLLKMKKPIHKSVKQEINPNQQEMF